MNTTQPAAQSLSDSQQNTSASRNSPTAMEAPGLALKDEAPMHPRIAVSKWEERSFILPLTTKGNQPYRNNQMKTRMTNLLKSCLRKLIPAFLTILAVCALSGCEKRATFKAAVDPAERISKGSPVLAGSHEVPSHKVGEVRRIQVLDDGELEAQFAVDKAFASQMRQGVVRIHRNGAIELRTDLATGTPLKAGAYIPLNSAFTVAVKRWNKYTPLILGGAALIAVICLLKLLLLRAAGPWIPLVLVFSLAFVTAYLTHAAVLPLIESAHSKLARSESTQTAPNTDAGHGKVRQAEEAFVRYLSNPVNAPRLLAFLIVFLITLVPYALLISWLRRRLACHAVTCAVLILAALPIDSRAAQVPSVKRDDVQRDIETVEALTLRAEQLATEARRLAKAGLPLPSQTVAVRAYFLTDRAGETEAANIGRIGLVSTWRMSADTKTALRARYQTVALRRAAIEDDIANTAATSTNSDNILRLYLLQREHIKARIRKGDSDEERLSKDLAKLAGVSATASPLIAAGALTIDTDYRVENGNIILPNGEVLGLGVTRVPPTNQAPREAKNTADIARLKREQQELQGAITELRRAKEQTNSAPFVEHLKVVIVTNIVEKAVPVPLPPEVRYITNTVFLPLTTETTESPVADTTINHQNSAGTEPRDSIVQADVVPDRSESTSNSDGSLMVATAQEPKATSNQELNASNTPTRGQRLFRWPPGNAYLLILGGLFLALVSVAVVVSAIRSKGPFEIELGEIEANVIQAHTFTLDTGECLVLKSRPSIEMKGDSAKPCIAVNWRGVSLLHPGPSQEIVLNGTPVNRPKTLNPGDELRLQLEGAEHTFVFRGVSQAEDEAREDAPFVSALNTTQTKN